MNQQQFFDSKKEPGHFFVVSCSLNGVIESYLGDLTPLISANHNIIGSHITGLPCFEGLGPIISDINQKQIQPVKDDFSSPLQTVFSKKGHVFSIYLTEKKSEDNQIESLHFWGINQVNTLDDSNLFQSMLDGFPFLIWFKDTESNYIAVNKSLAAVTKLKHVKKVVGKNDHDCFSAELANKYRADDQTVLTSLTPIYLEEKCVDEQGNETWIETWKAPFFVENQPIGTVGIARDVTKSVKEKLDIEAAYQFFSQVIDSIPDPVFVKNRNHEFTLVNQAFADFHVRNKQDFIGKTDYDFSPKDEVEVFLHHDELVFKSGKENINIEQATDALGNTKIISTKKTLVDKDTLVGVIRDITEISSLQADLEIKERNFRSLAENSPDLVARWNLNREHVYVNPAAEEFHKLFTDEVMWVGMSDPFEALEEAVQKVIDTQQKQVIDELHIQSDEYHFIQNVILVPEYDEQRQMIGVMGLGRDITDIYQLTSRLAQQEQSFRRLAENMPDIIIRYDLSIRRIYLNLDNQEQENKTNYRVRMGERPSENWVCSRNIQDAFDYERQIKKVIDSKEIHIWQQKFDLDQSGRLKDYECRAVPEFDEINQVESVLVVVRDVTEQIRFESELAYAANHDLLTDLPNRRFFEKKVNEFVQQQKDKFALLYLDLDNFKPVNDKLGHDIGDKVLKIVAARLKNSLDDVDICARLGGDEFGLVMHFEDFELDVLPKVELIIDLLSQPIALFEHDVRLSASIGIAVHPESNAESEDQLVRFADKAMYDAKEQGRNRYCVFDVSTHLKNELNSELIAELSHALNNDEICVFYQPIVDSNSEQVVKAEALVRWVHPEKGIISPLDFIPIAESSGLIIELGQQVFKKAATFAKYFNQFDYCRQLPSPFKVSINISARQLAVPEILNQWLDYLSINDIPGNYITIELTESLLIDDDPHIIAQLAMLQQHGVTISLDDFGTGYSALSYLKKFNIDYLKIDRSFIKDIAGEEHDRAIVEAIILMASRLNIKLVAEGVEQQEQTQLLKNVGCDLLQGYLYSKPLPEDEFVGWLKQTTRCC